MSTDGIKYHDNDRQIRKLKMNSSGLVTNVPLSSLFVTEVISYGERQSKVGQTFGKRSRSSHCSEVVSYYRHPSYNL